MILRERIEKEKIIVKKVLGFLLVIVLSVTLVACDNKLPQVREKDRVELNSSELVTILDDLLENVEIKNDTYQLDISFNANMSLFMVSVNSDEMFKVNAKINGDSSGKTKTSINAEVASSLLKTNFEGDLYKVPEDNNLYLNLKSKTIAQGIENSQTIKGKIPYNNFDDYLPGLVVPGNGNGFDINNLLESMDLELLDTLIEDYEGLTFYQRDNYFAAKFVINKKLFLSNPNIFGNVSIDELEDIKKMDVEIVIVFEDKKLADFGAKVNIEGNINEEVIKINAEIKFKTGVKIPNFPNFDNYKNLMGDMFFPN